MPELRMEKAGLFHKMTFDACRMQGFLEALPAGRNLVVAGCETHVCVLQTVLGLVAAGRRVSLVRDAVGSRRAESKETAIRRLEHHGVEVVTTEMVKICPVAAEADDPRLRQVIELVR